MKRLRAFLRDVTGPTALLMLVLSNAACIESHHQDAPIDPYRNLILRGYASAPNAEISILAREQDDRWVEVGSARAGSTPALAANSISDNPDMFAWSSSFPLATTADEVYERWQTDDGVPYVELRAIEQGGTLPDLRVFPEGGIACVAREAADGLSFANAALECQDGEQTDLRLRAAKDPFKGYVSVDLVDMRALDVTDQEGWDVFGINDRDEVYFSLWGAIITDGEEPKPLSRGRISPAPPEDYFGFKDGTRRSIHILDFELAPGQRAGFGLIAREQDFAERGPVLAIVTNLVKGVISLAEKDYLEAAGSFYWALKELENLQGFDQDGDENLGRLIVEVSNDGEALDVMFDDDEGARVVWADDVEADVVFEGAGARYEATLRVDYTPPPSPAPPPPACRSGEFCCEPLPDGGCNQCIPAGASCP